MEALENRCAFWNNKRLRCRGRLSLHPLQKDDFDPFFLYPFPIFHFLPMKLEKKRCFFLGSTHLFNVEGYEL